MSTTAVGHCSQCDAVVNIHWPTCLVCHALIAPSRETRSNASAALLQPQGVEGTEGSAPMPPRPFNLAGLWPTEIDAGPCVAGVMTGCTGRCRNAGGTGTCGRCVSRMARRCHCHESGQSVPSITRGGSMERGTCESMATTEKGQ